MCLGEATDLRTKPGVTVDTLRSTCKGEGRALSVFDLACGNLRFEVYLADALPETALTFYAVDNCDSTNKSGIRHQVHYQNLDVLSALHKNQPLAEQFAAPLCDVSASFGFLHHVPLKEHRQELLTSLVQQTLPGGLVIITFWRFLDDAALAKKAQVTHAQALQELELPDLDDGDYLLGWKNTPGTYRYCHSFNEAEIDQLAGSLADKTLVVSRFTADGKTGTLNTYLILKVL
jgi:SAM-dependent methyltransferase